MLPVDDVAIQLVDLPSISTTHAIPWIGNALGPADGCLFVVDLCEAGCLERAVAVRELLAERQIVLTSSWEADGEDEADPFTKHLPTIMVINKVELLEDSDEEISAFRELTGFDFEILPVSVERGHGVERIGPLLFERLGVVRVYTKAPGKSPDMGRPFTLRTGQTVLDLAGLVHKDIARGFKYARLWGDDSFEGQQVGRDHLLVDGDVVELHA
jgi:ribosome-interacting GTPase 1